jgi:hypothetical protein
MKKLLSLTLALMFMALGASCSGNTSNEQTEAPPPENVAPIPDNAYIIADYYNEDGTFSSLGLALEEANMEKVLTIKEGEVFVVNGRQYRVMVEELTVSFYTQSSIAEVFEWWSDYTSMWEINGTIAVIPR